MSFSIRDLFAQPFDASRFAWEPFRPGVEMCPLYGGAPDAPAAALLRYAPHASVPRHVHRGYEHILILSGAQQDERGRYEAGTLLVSEPGTSHKVSSEQGCVVLAIWERPVEMQE